MVEEKKETINLSYTLTENMHGQCYHTYLQSTFYNQLYSQ